MDLPADPTPNASFNENSLANFEPAVMESVVSDFLGVLLGSGAPFFRSLRL